MNDWSRQRRKKERESRHLRAFLDAYNLVTESSTELVYSSERPDFICRRGTGTNVGIELTRITRGDPDQIFWEEILEGRGFMARDEVLEEVERLTLLKESKRRDPNWTYCNRTILVLQLMETALSRVRSCLNFEILPDLENVGFSEVWVADLKALEVFGTADLFALHHPRLSGHQKLNQYKKPWG